MKLNLPFIVTNARTHSVLFGVHSLSQANEMIKIPLLICLTLLISHVIWCLCDYFFVQGISTIIDLIWPKPASLYSQQGGIHWMQKIEHKALGKLASLGKLGEFASAMCSVIFGLGFIIWYSMILFHMWKLWYFKVNEKSNETRHFERVFLIASIVVNIIVAAVFFWVNLDTSDQFAATSADLKSFVNTFAAYRPSPQNQDLVVKQLNHSAAKIKAYIRLFYINMYLGVASLVVLLILTGVFLIIEAI